MEQHIDGKWEGKLIYGRGFGELENEQLFFTLEINQYEDEFSGISYDIDGIGINPERVSVHGFLDGDTINFVKHYKSIAWFSASNKAFTTVKKNNYEISFTGTYNHLTQSYEGSWLILIAYTAFGNVFFEKNTGGRWSMQKEKP